jgi:hypothetical protein
MALESYIPVVEEAITAFGISAEENRLPDGKTWALKRGSATVYMTINHVNNYFGERDILVLHCPIAPIPEGQNLHDVFERMLRENHAFVSERFTIYENYICLVTARDLSGLSSDEVKISIDSFTFMADAFDDKVKAALGIA